ncbi:hypothetical protein FOL47_008933 [Perkinsus chesapeaki]|uniref:Uncharacterized protein n=1 Tax=Perkinsus chesapeaki TaxID=330153 RepID=A0A7J6N1T0_PERCH|nr:hypothetical protein FOL47_008933 [Perkinsus chesapeaki]
MRIESLLIVAASFLGLTSAQLAGDNGMFGSPVTLVSSRDVESVLKEDSSDSLSVPDWFDSTVAKIKSWADSELKKIAWDLVDDLGHDIKGEDMYWNFVPRHVATLSHSSEQRQEFEGRCFKSVKIHSYPEEDGSLTIEATYKHPTSPMCAEYLILGNSADFDMQYRFFHGTETYKWTSGSGKVYIFDLRTSFSSAVEGIIKTADFMFSHDVFEFLKRFPELTFDKRADPGIPDIKEDDIHPGDAVLVTYMVGSSASIMWVSGSVASHSVIFLRDPGTGILHAVEASAQGIHKMTFEEFLKEDAGWYNNAVLVPLKEEQRAKFDNDAAWKKFVTDFEGNDYGYNNLVFSAIDSMDGNYPCLPMDDYQTCLSWEFVEVLCGLLDRVSPEMANLLFLQGYNHRIGTTGLNMTEIVKVTELMYPGLSGVLPALPEEDQWEYPIHHDGKPTTGPSRVCSALVCEMLRAGGIFGDHEVSCTEFTPWDIYSMDIFTTPTYQLKGQKSITDHMAESCRTQITADSYYERAPHC